MGNGITVIERTVHCHVVDVAVACDVAELGHVDAVVAVDLITHQLS